ncbi:hypothetical protein S40285_01679 [Stachybotrys chlorohalonatus IBT 40285]|uniref:Uncharacterized protein n=1 Tax=Stachybotrys chlorohalonatus (strain IBT 40285) TaxID=1283841 RepID=A0A084QDV5_STAC4|nr:hypothetical protein S40285_01679 [Stachybotrys chlorohalonata IBT 40285]
MGGKTWSYEEEKFYWEIIIPRSMKAPWRADRQNDWKECVDMMTRKFGTVKEGARRAYTYSSMLEHYFQNVTTGQRSPRAGEFVRKHMKLKVEAEAIEGEDEDDEMPCEGRRARRVRKAEYRAKKAREPVQPIKKLGDIMAASNFSSMAPSWGWRSSIGSMSETPSTSATSGNITGSAMDGLSQNFGWIVE